MSVANKTILITGANRGIGQALVEEALRRGAQLIYAGTRQPWSHPDPRIVPLTLDITDQRQVEAAAKRVASLDVLVNNAGLAFFDDLSEREAIQRHLAVNLYGTYAMSQAFLPALTRTKGAVVNVLSVVAVAALPITPAYSISKAAALSLSQSLRAMLASRGVSVHAVLAGPVDTEMSREFPVPKAPTGAVARAIFDGVARGDEEIFPDVMSATLSESWNAGAVKALEHQFATFVPAPEAVA